MSTLAPTLEAFFTERLMHQRQVSPNTVAAYRDAWRLLLDFVQQRSGKQPYELDLADLDAELIASFLTHLETERHNSVRTRNARLAAIRCFFRFAALRHPEHAALISRVLDIPTKHWEQAVVNYLNEAESEALVASPATETWCGRRDRALSPSPYRPVCESRSSPGCATATSSWAAEPTCAVGQGAKSRELPRCAPRWWRCSAPG